VLVYIKLKSGLINFLKTDHLQNFAYTPNRGNANS